MSISKFVSLACLTFAGLQPMLAGAQVPTDTPVPAMAAPVAAPVPVDPAAALSGAPATSPVPAMATPAPSAAQPAALRLKLTTAIPRELVTIESLADAQRKALQDKERELRNKNAPAPTAGATAAPVAAPKPTPVKTRRLHAIYTNAEGELIAEIVHQGVIKQFRDNERLDGGLLEIEDEQQVRVLGVSPVSCDPKRSCPKRDVVLRVGTSF